MKLISRFIPQIIYIVTLFSIVFFMGFTALYLAVGPSLPEVESIRKIRLQTPMRVYSKDNQLIAEFGDTKRIPITLDQVPKNFINALLSTEDERFYSHSGVDILGVLRAIERLIVTQTKSQGASTITMQVARNYYLSRERRFSRKFTEMFLAWKIESELSKDEILELYLNKIHFSHRAYGLGAAAQIYYGSTLKELSLGQLATLAGIPQGPSVLNPISNPTRALARRSHVLGRMLTENHITQQQYDDANAEPIETKRHGADIDIEAPYLAEMVRSEIIERYGKEVAYNNGLNIYTTLDPKLQRFAQQAVKKGLEEYDQRHGYRGPEQHFELTENTTEEQMNLWVHTAQIVADIEPALVVDVNDEVGIATILLQSGKKASLGLEDFKWATRYVDENNQGPAINAISQVIITGDLIRVGSETITTETETSIKYRLTQLPDASAGFVSLKPDNGAIEALVGGYDYYYKKFNTVTQANRQLGSNIKPFVYSAAFEKGFTPASIINDMPFVEEDITSEDIWRPKNDGDKYNGPTRLRLGLKSSKNTVSIRLIRDIGPRYTKRYLTKIGFPADKMQPYLSLALGSPSFTPLEVVTGYAVLANGGYKVAPWFIDRVEDSNGRIMLQHQPMQVCRECERIIKDQLETAALTENNHPEHQDVEITEQPKFINVPLLPVPEEFIAPRVLDERNRYMIDSILKDVIHSGTAFGTLYRAKSKLLQRNDLSGKTGTTNDAKDAWFSGYNTKHVATAWFGFDDHARKLGNKEWGGKAALPIWNSFMENTLKSEQEYNHPRPEGIVTVRIDALTGLLATSQTKKAIFEIFRSENAPTTYAEESILDPFNRDDEIIDDDSLF